jgi:hypothetical protein
MLVKIMLELFLGIEILYWVIWEGERFLKKGKWKEETGQNANGNFKYFDFFHNVLTPPPIPHHHFKPPIPYHTFQDRLLQESCKLLVPWKIGNSEIRKKQSKHRDQVKEEPEKSPGLQGEGRSERQRKKRNGRGGQIILLGSDSCRKAASWMFPGFEPGSERIPTWDEATRMRTLGIFGSPREREAAAGTKGRPGWGWTMRETERSRESGRSS